MVTIPGVTGVCHGLTEGVLVSYSGSGTLSGGRVTIKDGSTIVLDVDIPNKDLYRIPWRKHCSPGNALVVTLYAGGSNVTGKVNLLGYAALIGASPGADGDLDFSDWVETGLLGLL